jgi:hypothetical protein
VRSATSDGCCTTCLPNIGSFLFTYGRSEAILLSLFVRGQLINYPWSRFLADFKYGPGMKPMGRTYRISAKAFSEAPATGDDQYFTYLLEHYLAETEIGARS